jgi:hypothetical protein
MSTNRDVILKCMGNLPQKMLDTIGIEGILVNQMPVYQVVYAGEIW